MPRSGFRRGAALIDAVAAGARDDFLTFSLYHLKIASNFQVPIPTFDRTKKTASTRAVDAVFVRRVGACGARWRGVARTRAAPPHAARAGDSAVRERGFD
ncbi:hypothetical protein [Burkholderia territorii]|uniref:hypothetical protein n=1 Tax=Burkholderia territorii TaxID=1503055 RepID=UPI0007BAD031|nr:hypothetical protein [Burkholderia territorii]